MEQNATMALSIASHGYVMETGRIVLDKPAAELLRDDDVREFYLGLHPGRRRADEDPAWPDAGRSATSSTTAARSAGRHEPARTPDREHA